MLTSKVNWWVSLADTKPLLFSVAILLCSVSILALVVRNREEKLNSLEFQSKIRETYWSRLIDSTNRACAEENVKLNGEIKEKLNIIIDGYKDQLKEQKASNEKITNTIKTNRKIIEQTSLKD